MDDTEFKPGELGRDIPVLQQSAGTPESRKHPLTGPQGMPEENIEKTLDAMNNTGKPWHPQAYPIRLLKQRYGLSHNYAAVVAAELHWGGA